MLNVGQLYNTVNTKISITLHLGAKMETFSSPRNMNNATEILKNNMTKY